MPEQSSCASPAEAPADDLRVASDERLFDAIRRGSERHFNALYDRYFRRVYGFVYARVRDRADAEELTQESFTAVFRSIAGYSGRSTPLAWIYGIAKNTVNNHLRRARSAGRAAGEPPARAPSEWGSTPQDDLEMRRAAPAHGRALRSVTRLAGRGVLDAPRRRSLDRPDRARAWTARATRSARACIA